MGAIADFVGLFAVWFILLVISAIFGGRRE